jgi:hypothetical protein
MPAKANTMHLQARLERLERAAVRLPSCLTRPLDFGAGQQALLAYCLGAGPAPPRPPGVDPVVWDRKLRIECCLLERVRGAMKPGEYLPNMTEDDCQEVDQLDKVIAQWDWAPPWLKEP